MSAYASVVLDVDSTLCGVEGVDWLAARRGPAVAATVSRLTQRAMAGTLSLDSVYGERLALIRPSADDLRALADAYRESVAPGAREVLARLREAGVTLVLVSGGIREAILPCAAELGFVDGAVHAVHVELDAAGRYAGYDTASPLATQAGKCTVVRALCLPRPVLAVGDGATDAEVRPAVSTFAAFTGFVQRPAVVDAADREVRSFEELLEIVLP